MDTINVDFVLLPFSILYGTGVLAYAGRLTKYPGLKYVGASYLVYAVMSLCYLTGIPSLIILGNMFEISALMIYIFGMLKFLGGGFRHTSVVFSLAAVFAVGYTVPALMDHSRHPWLMPLQSAAILTVCLFLFYALRTRAPRPMSLAYTATFWAVSFLGAHAFFRIFFDSTLAFELQQLSERKEYIINLTFTFTNVLFILTTSLAVIWLTNELLIDELREQALRDPLTRLLNRRALLETAEREMKRAVRHGAPISSIMVDLDHFKQVNDTYGHLVGDRVLSELSALLQETVRRTDFLFRYGGEEFLLLLVETDSSAALSVAEKILSGVRKHRFANDHQLELTASLGVTSRKDGEESWERLVNRSDQALYEAKNGGRNRIITT